MLLLLQFHWIELLITTSIIICLFCSQKTRLFGWILAYISVISLIVYSHLLAHMTYTKTPEEVFVFLKNHHVYESLVEVFRSTDALPWQWSLSLSPVLILLLLVFASFIQYEPNEEIEVKDDNEIKKHEEIVLLLKMKIGELEQKLSMTSREKDVLDAFIKERQTQYESWAESNYLITNKYVALANKNEQLKKAALIQCKKYEEALKASKTQQKQHLGQIQRLAVQKKANELLCEELLCKNLISKKDLSKMKFEAQKEAKSLLQ